MADNKTQLNPECNLMPLWGVRHPLGVQQPSQKGADFLHKLYHSLAISMSLQAPPAELTRCLLTIMELLPWPLLTVTNYCIKKLRDFEEASLDLLSEARAIHYTSGLRCSGPRFWYLKLPQTPLQT